MDDEMFSKAGTDTDDETPRTLTRFGSTVEFHFVGCTELCSEESDFIPVGHFVRKQIPMFPHHLFPPQDQPYPTWISFRQLVRFRKPVEHSPVRFFKINRVGRFSRLLIDCRHLLSNHWIKGPVDDLTGYRNGKPFS